MAAKKKSARKPKAATPAQTAAIRKSFLGIVAAQKKVNLLIKQHQAKVSPMFFAL